MCRMQRHLLTALTSLTMGVILFQSSVVAQGPSAARELERLRSELPEVPLFDQWLEETGELPPDFSQLPAVPYPQPLLTVTRDGKPHRLTAGEWPAQREVLREAVEQWITGHAPPAPGNVRAVIESKTSESTHEVWALRLEFGPDHAAKLPCWLWVPHSPKVTPLPVYMSDNQRYARFGMKALEEGRFAVCIYGATDRKPDPSEVYKDLFGDYDWAEFRRRAWSASRAVDWLTTLDFVDKDRIYIGGHSRSGKQSLIAAAFDDRIAGVIGSSPGSGGSLHFRFCDGYYMGESAEVLTRLFPYWVTPRVRFFAGRENQLPADTHMIYALVAPRPLLMSTAIHDNVESTWAVERMFEQVSEVYELLGQPQNIGLRYRPGEHRPDDETYVGHSDFLLRAAEGKGIGEGFPYRPYHPWDYETWAAQQRPADAPTPVTADAARDEVAQRLDWLLGEAPVSGDPQILFTPAPAPAPPAPGAAEPAADEVIPHKVTFGNGLTGDVFYPAAGTRSPAITGPKLPAILWLGPFTPAWGYKSSAYRTGERERTLFTDAGFVMMGFNPIGTGDRQEERRTFYERYKNWSLMGKMVQDARDALTGLAACPDVDPKRIYVAGYGMGGMVATFTMALDDRPAGAAVIAGFTPFRPDTDARGTGGARRWSHLYGWLPRLGPFVGRESEIPLDFDAILASAAPRPMLVVAPTRDWHATHEDVAAAVTAARGAYASRGAADALSIQSPDRWIEFNPSMQAQVVQWLSARAGLAPARP